MPERVTMTCMTTKQKFDVDDPPVVVLSNGRYAYKTPCPWTGKNDKQLNAFKFCSKDAHTRYVERNLNSVQSEAIAEQSDVIGDQ